MKVCRTCKRIYRVEEDFLAATSRWRVGVAKELRFDCSCGSTQVLPAGAHSWYHPTKLMRPGAREVFNRLALADVIPRLPEAIYALQDAINDPETPPAQVVAALKREPVIAADVLRLANLSRRATTLAISSLEHALAFVGRRIVADLVLAASVKQFTFQTSRFTAATFWTEAFAGALIAERLAVRLRRVEAADLAYVGACLVNIGKVVAAVCLPEALDAVYSRCQSERVTWRQAEQGLGAPQHEILGEIAAVLWGVPDVVARAAGAHHAAPPPRPDGTASRTDVLHGIIVLATQLTHALLDQHYRQDEALLRMVSAFLAVDQATLDELLVECLPLREKVAALVGAASAT